MGQTVFTAFNPMDFAPPMQDAMVVAAPIMAAPFVPLVEPPKTLSSLTASSKAVEEAPALAAAASLAPRNIAPIVKPKNLRQETAAAVGMTSYA
jgi:hypothetical protein